MADIAALREKRNTAATAITGMAKTLETERRDFKPEELVRWNQANADFDQAKRELDVAERAEEVRREQERPVGDRRVGREDYNPREKRKKRENVQATDEQRSLALKAWARKQTGKPLTRDQQAACKALRFDPRVSEIEIDTWSSRHLKTVQAEWRGADRAGREAILRRESRANMSSQIPQSGGYLVAPGTLAANFELNLLAFGDALGVADIITTEHGEPYLIPIVDDTANVGALMAENTQAMSSGINPSLLQQRMDAYKFTSTPVLIPTELMEDENYSFDEQVGEMLGTRLGRGQAPYLATGTGASQPQGIVTGSVAGVTAASATAIKFDELVDLEHSVNLAYRKTPGVGWLMHDLVKAYIRKIKDGNGKPLWVSGEYYTSGTTDGAPEKLLNYPVNICLEMASTVATGNITVLFGCLPKFKVRRVRGVRMYRLTERFRDLDQDGFIAFQRIDSRVINTGTAPIKRLTQP